MLGFSTNTFGFTVIVTGLSSTYVAGIGAGTLGPSPLNIKANMADIRNAKVEL